MVSWMHGDMLVTKDTETRIFVTCICGYEMWIKKGSDAYWEQDCGCMGVLIGDVVMGYEVVGRRQDNTRRRRGVFDVMCRRCRETFECSAFNLLEGVKHKCPAGTVVGEPRARL